MRTWHDERRLKIVAVTPELLLMAAQSGTRAAVVTKNALPADARIVGVSMGDDNRYVLFKVQSESYPVVSDGKPIPRAEPIEFDADLSSGPRVSWRALPPII